MSSPDEVEPAPLATDGRPRRRWRRPSAAPRTRRQRVYSLIGWATLAVGVLALVWVVVTGLIARNRLEHVRAQLSQLRSALSAGDLAKAQTLAAQIRDDAHTAHVLTTGPAWWVASGIPFLGSPLDTSRIIAAQADQVGQRVLPGVVQLVRQVEHGRPVHGSTVDLDSVAQLLPQLQDSAGAVHSAVQHVEAASPSWLPFVSSARSSVLTQLDRLDGELTGASRSAGLLLPMLGRSGPQRYFIGFLNEAESRGLGGIPGAFAIVTADHGRITFEKFGTDDDLKGVRARVDLGPDYLARYRQDDPLGTFQNSDVSPDFRDAAAIWASVWQQKTGQRIDGAIAVDPAALSYLLRVTGSARLADGSKVTADNVVALTQQRQYSLFAENTPRENAERKAYLVGVAKAVSGRLTHGGDARELVKALSRAARERRLLVWSAQPDLEQQLIDANWAGAVVPPPAGALAGFTVNNASGGKIDYYVHRTMTYQRDGCGAGGGATAVLTLRNAAPSSGLPSYVTTRLDPAPPGSGPGSELLIVTYYATPGATIQQVELDGASITVAPAPERGLVTATVRVELAAGATRTVRIRLGEPAAAGPLTVLRQPGVQPFAVTTTGACERS